MYDEFATLAQQGTITQAEITAIKAKQNAIIARYNNEKSQYLTPLINAANAVPAALQVEAQAVVESSTRFVNLILGLFDAIRLLYESLEERIRTST